MKRQTADDKFRAVVRFAASQINDDLCILTSMVWIVRHARTVTDEHLAEFTSAALRIQAQAGGLLYGASKDGEI